MTENARAFLDDPLGCKADLNDALTDPALDTVQADGRAGPDGARAAYRLALALGRCRLFGVEPGDEVDGVLPPHLALAATAELARCLRKGADDADRLPEHWDEAVDPAEADELCAGLLSRRMEAWAASLALDEAHLDCADEGDARASALAEVIDRMHDALDRFDAALEAQTQILATITATRLLDNWRVMLAGPYKEDLPWWLDGRLEEAARRSEKEAVRTLPSRWTSEEPCRGPDRAQTAAPLLPPVAETRLAAAATPSTAPPVLPGETYSWASPDGRWQAELVLPDQLTPSQEAAPRPLNFTSREDGHPAAALAGHPIRLGSVARAIDGQGKAWVRLAELRGGEPLRLRVADEVWIYEPQGE